MSSRPARRAWRRLLADPPEDPLAGLANLFDAGMVFALALVVALVTALGARSEGLRVDPDAPRLERYRASTREAGGEATRLGTAYRLRNGDVIYVPD